MFRRWYDSHVSINLRYVVHSRRYGRLQLTRHRLILARVPALHCSISTDDAILLHSYTAHACNTHQPRIYLRQRLPTRCSSHRARPHPKMMVVGAYKNCCIFGFAWRIASRAFAAFCSGSMSTASPRAVTSVLSAWLHGIHDNATAGAPVRSAPLYHKHRLTGPGTRRE
jgi:hypothetical protein